MTEQLSMNAQVDLEGIMVNKMSDKERQIPHCIMYMWNLTKYSKLVNTTKKKQTTDKENKLVVASGEKGQDKSRELRCSNNYVLRGGQTHQTHCPRTLGVSVTWLWLCFLKMFLCKTAQ